MDTISKPWMSRRDVLAIETILSWWPMYCYEYGSGGSTIYFKDKCKYWMAIEHDREWHDKVEKAGGNVCLTHDEGSYIRLPQVHLDFILVDGILRLECLEEASKTDAIVILHDARRDEYLEGVKKFRWYRRMADDLIVMTQKPHKRYSKLIPYFHLWQFFVESLLLEITRPNLD